MFSRLEQKTGTTISNGRMDQYFYPFYKKDMEAGTLTDEKTLEYLECMWVGMAEFIDMYISPAGAPSTKATLTGKPSPLAARPRTAATRPTI